MLRIDKGRVQRTPVTLGLRGLALSEVVDGLRAGDRVLAAGAVERNQLPADGARVRWAGQPFPGRAPAGAAASDGGPPVRLD